VRFDFSFQQVVGSGKSNLLFYQRFYLHFFIVTPLSTLFINGDEKNVDKKR